MGFSPRNPRKVTLGLQAKDKLLGPWETHNCVLRAACGNERVHLALEVCVSPMATKFVFVWLCREHDFQRLQPFESREPLYTLALKLEENSLIIKDGSPMQHNVLSVVPRQAQFLYNSHGEGVDRDLGFPPTPVL